MSKRFRFFLANESGATAVEYALLCGIISIIILTSLAVISTKLNNTFNEVTGNLS
jgi:pilus assembly protein Flp/PilA